MNMPADYYDEDEQITNPNASADVNADTDNNGVQTLGDERSHEQMHRECAERSSDDTAQEE